MPTSNINYLRLQTSGQWVSPLALKNLIGREYEYQTLWHVACMLIISERTKWQLVLELTGQKKKK